MNEGVIHKTLSKVLMNHTIKQYADNIVNDKFMDMGLAVPMFLEYGPGGDLDQMRNQKNASMKRISGQFLTVWLLE